MGHPKTGVDRPKPSPNARHRSSHLMRSILCVYGTKHSGLGRAARDETLGRSAIALRAGGLCFANGHDVDSVYFVRLTFHARLDASHQCFDLTTAQAVVDVNPVRQSISGLGR